MPQHMPLGILVSMTAAWKGSLVRVPGVPTKAVVRVIKLLFYKARRSAVYIGQIRGFIDTAD